MGDAAEDRAKARDLPEGDVIGILLEQHAQVRDLFAEIQKAPANERQEPFDRLRALLAVHETAEEMVLRPQAKDSEWKDVATERNQEEEEANKVLAALEDMDTASEAFLAKLKEFEESVDEHAEAEESQEFPRVLNALDVDERLKLGSRLQAVEKMGPTHPHPAAAGSTTAQALTGPFAAMADRVRDALSR
ncbi:MAG TPA: hemerythrin domain-containing protein [Nocardioides sp.]|uniref:hemerythrin domain-containing protein n=1 Tax=Nocardioides sp. TaxID=35761 RepID=UPI002F40AB52